MTAPVDPASEIVNTFITTLRQAFNPADSVQAPLGGGSTTVRFFASDGGLPYAPGCREPFLWVRVDRRYRSRRRDFPAAYVGDPDCKDADVARAVAVEVGVARCTSEDAKPNWSRLADEAEIGLDDSWRVELALCRAATVLRDTGHAVALDTIAPVGPEGGLIAWTGMAYVQF
jgi:hypothetical protein